MAKHYLDLLQDILDNGIQKGDRTGTGTLSVFGRLYRHDLSTGFPLLTTKKLHIKSIIHELLWFLQGGTNIRSLNENGVTIWDEWANENGDLGPIYGAQWRAWRGENGEVIDQVEELLKGIKQNPNSRRHIINAWHVSFLPDEKKSAVENVANGKMALAPCHVMYQFWVANRKLSCMLTQRSADCFLGVPYNMASLAFLTSMVAQQCDLAVGDIVHSFGDLHLYLNHLEQAKLQLSRTPRALPTLTLKRKPDSIFDYRFDDFEIQDYDPYPVITAQISV